MIEASSYKLKKTEKEIISHLAQLGASAFHDEDIVQQGRKLVIPEGMTLRQAQAFLDQKIKESERVTNFSRRYNYRPLDGAACMFRAMKRVFGSVGHRGKMGFWGELSPEMRSVHVGVDETEQIPWGRFSLPFLPDTLFETDWEMDDELGPLFVLTVKGPKMFAAQIEGVFKIVADELESASIYRGKAIDGRQEPEFVDLSGINPRKVIFTEEVAMQLEANIWAQLRHTEQMELHSVPLKRAVLVYGPFGSGKTLAAGITGQIATANGWTYIKARPGRDDFLSVLQTARLYQPAVVFCEDVDTISDPTEAQETITKLLDDFDGIEAKNTRILCVLTTNHPEKIHKGMLRPGRLDAIIHIASLDHDGVERLIKAVVSDGLLGDDVDWNEVALSMDGFLPAFVREAADRAVRYAVVRGGGTAVDALSTEDFVHAAAGLRPQLEMMEEASDQAQRDPVGVALQKTVTKVLREEIRDDLLNENDA
jgi:transitional endoplasmic reticulum ATPase